MTTYTLNAFYAEEDPNSDTTLGIGLTTLSIVFGNGASPLLSYTLEPNPDPENPLTEVEWDGTDLYGAYFGTPGGAFADFNFQTDSYGIVNWNDSSGTPRTTTVLVFDGDNDDGSRAYVFIIPVGGDPLPSFSNAAEWDAFTDENGVTNPIITSFDPPPVAPGVNIDLTALGAFSAVSSEDDYIADEADPGDPGRNFVTGPGDDTIIGDEAWITATLGEGDDYFEAGPGGGGVDYTPETGGGGITADLGTGMITDTFGDTDTLVNVTTINGSAQDDVITGSNGFDDITGGAGNDTINALGGNDWVWSDVGNETIDGGDGEDTLFYEVVNSGIIVNNTGTMQGGVAAFTANKGGNGTDSIQNIENLHGSNLIGSGDQIFITDQGGYVFDRAGDDYVEVTDNTSGTGGVAFYVGSGNDTFIGSTSGGDTLDFLDDGYDAKGGITQGVTVTFTGFGSGTVTDGWGDSDVFSEIENIRGSNLDDTIIGDDNDNYLNGREGDDQINGNGGDDFIEGDDGDDIINAGDGRDDVVGGEGDDTLDGGSGSRDELRYDHENGGQGVNVNFNTGFVTDSFGDTDTVSNFEEVRGTDQQDSFTGSAADEERFQGLGGDDTFAGGDGRDRIDGGAGDDYIDGGAGDRDQARYNNDHHYGGTMGIDADLQTGTVTDTFGDTDTLVGIEQINGSFFDDVIRGDGLDNYFWGGEQGDDLIEARGGDDFLSGGGGDDTLDGGADVDTVEYAYEHEDGGTQGITANLALGSATDTYGDTDTLISIENIIGSVFNDTITGDALDNRLRGDDGDDVINAGDGRDDVSGDAGDDTLDGGAGTRDELRYDWENGGQGVTVNFATGTATDTHGDTDTISNFEEVRGTNMTDSLTGSAADEERFKGYGGDDTISGGDGRDRIDGGAGDDTIDGGAGDRDQARYQDDHEDGGTMGIDADLVTGIVTDTFGDTDTLIGIEQINGSLFDDTIRGDANGNAFWGGFDGDDILDGRGGDDYFTGGDGNDTIIGGTGFDTVAYEWEHEDGGSQGINANLGTNTVTDTFGDTDTLNSVEELIGSVFADTITGSASADVINGFDGDDTITGGDGNDDLSDGDGDDNVNGGDGDDIIRTGSGTDIFNGGAGVDTLITDLSDASNPQAFIVELNLSTGDMGAKGNPNLRDQVFGIENFTFLGDFDVELTGNGAANSFNLDQGDDTVNAGAGADEVRAGTGNDTVDGGGGADTLFGEGGNDTLMGGFANDLLFGGSGDDILSGGDSNDSLFGNAGSDQMDGGNGSDLFIIDGQDTVTDTGSSGYDKAQINDANGVAAVLAGWSGVERVNGFTGDDQLDGSSLTTGTLLFGDDGNDTLTGGSGGDVLIGGNGDDILTGNGGNDIMLGNAGNDTFDGGAGDDVFFIGESGDVVTDGGSGFDKAVITDTNGLSINVGSWLNVERINGLTGDDTINANGMATGVTLVGSGGNDTLTGGSGNDTFYGGADNDTLIGGAGADALIGSAGDDNIDGGAGNDFYLGGTGADVFMWSDGFGVDVVKDFTDGIDRLDFTNHSGVNALGDLTINQSGNHTVITMAIPNGDQITLADTLATSLTGADFDFV